MTNQVLELFRRGEKSLGTFTHMMSAPAVEALAYTGLDYVIIDMEHSPVQPEGAAGLISAALGSGLCPLVRVDAIERSPVLKALDAGAMGIIVPQVETVEQVKRLVGFSKFAPLGSRGFCLSRDGGWGLAENCAAGMAGYMAWANENTLLIPQCETAGCLGNIEEIVSVQGVDGIFIGPFDLSIALGIPGDFENPAHRAAVERVLAACRAAGKPCFMFCGSGQEAAEYFARGFDSATVGLDISVMQDAYRALSAAARGSK